jgi:hypothetical protein
MIFAFAIATALQLILAHELNKVRDPFDRSKLAVIIEDRDLPALTELLLDFLVKVPPEWPFKVYCGIENNHTLQTSHLLRPYVDSGKLEIAILPNETTGYHGTEWLSHYLTRPTFWELLAPAESLLFFQSDSMICSRSNYTVNDFLGLDMFEGGYDWLGAKWPNFPSYAGGNGGFSIRRRSTMLNITRQHGDQWDGGNEVNWVQFKLNGNLRLR